MRTSVLIGLMLVTAAMGVLSADSVSAEDPRDWCTVHVGDPTPTGVTCGPEGPICGGVIVGGFPTGCRP